MSLNINLRTVCGCERGPIAIPHREYPDYFEVAYCRQRYFHMCSDDADVAPTFSKRRFEWTGQRGLYDYPVYLEVLPHES